MFGAMEILMILIIFGIIYGRDAIDRTFRKNPDEGTVESLAYDIRDYYKDNPKRVTLMIVGIVLAVALSTFGVYWVVAKTKFLRSMGLQY
ncbi:MAG: hypothetical protein HZA02_09510 [Nitrospinae bacterium]|nr:hypothetical protein [Nitrospinota bacterium]